jgi:hypothetical protein
MLSTPRSGLEVLFAHDSGPLLNRPGTSDSSKGLREPYAAGVQPSLGSVGNAPDNAMCESVFARL